jgi:hypothetical protein
MSVAVHRDNGSVRLFIRSLEPSTASMLAGVLLALLLIGGHVLLISINNNTTPSALHDPILLLAYENYVMAPLLNLTNNSTINNIIAIILWGLFGWFLYGIVAVLSKQYHDWHEARRQIRLVEDQVVSGRQTTQLGEHVAWRVFMAFMILGFTLLVQPWMHRCFEASYQLLDATNWSEALRAVGTAFGLWLLMLHGYTVLLRLYLFRTRILGEILY